MKKTLILSLLASVLFLCAGAFGQTVLTTTTLSTALQGVGSVNGATPTGNLSILSVASATGISAPSPNTSLTSGILATSEAQTYLYVDRELMQVKNVSGTTITVIRGVAATASPSHASGAVVFVIPLSAQILWSGSTYGQSPAVPEGSCTRSSELYLPRIQFESGIISDCLNGQWYAGDALQTTRVHSKVLYEPQPGAVAYASVGTSTALVAGTFYCTEIQLPYSKLATGLAVLNGATVTGNQLVALYDSGMNLLANSATAGVAASGTSTYQQISFTTPYYMVGPAQYFGCVQASGISHLNMLVTGTQDQYLTTSKTGVFGTIPATITAPTTFTTAVGPYFGIF